ncbi:MAG: hypothetical protein IJ358_03010 [Clostridia bacterium]|nr:hypothetical protein [Clostridia bacterium]
MSIRDKLEKLMDDYCYKEGIFASAYEKQMKKACKLGKIKFYDKDNYNDHMKLLFYDCEKPEVFDNNFIKSLPDYNFLGIPIKRLIQNDCANGCCYSIILMLSLCFENFKIVTAELDNYAQYYKNNSYNTDYKHCYLILPNDMVIDTTFGIICKKDVYTKIFKPSNCKYISNEELKCNKLYQYLQSLKDSTYDMIFPQFKDVKLDRAMDTTEYWDLFFDWQEKCVAYKNENNTHIENYFKEYIARTSNPHDLWNWMLSVQFHKDQLEDDNKELLQL